MILVSEDLIMRPSYDKVRNEDMQEGLAPRTTGVYQIANIRLLRRVCHISQHTLLLR